MKIFEIYREEASSIFYKMDDGINYYYIHEYFNNLHIVELTVTHKYEHITDPLRKAKITEQLRRCRVGIIFKTDDRIAFLDYREAFKAAERNRKTREDKEDFEQFKRLVEIELQEANGNDTFF
jgi:hypothetical protein